MAKRKSNRPTIAEPSAVASQIAGIVSGFDPKNPDTVENVASGVKDAMRLFFLKMNSKQEEFVRIKNRHGRMPKTRLYEGGNQSGKTTIGIAEDLAHAFGYRPWLKPDDPDFKIKIKVPNVGMVGCEVAGQN